jgi:pseudouridine-5'-phosphate glycosidase
VTTPLRCTPEIAAALSAGKAVVALETTLIAHGFPAGEGVLVGEASETAVRSAGAVPATIGVLDGEVFVGLDATTLGTFDQAGAAARKLGPRDLAACLVQRALGATTVGGTLAICGAAGIRVLATGGLGGVHRGFTTRPDVSAELARTPAIVVCSGVKSLLDVPATCELLETLGVPVLGFRTDELPLFYASRGGPPVSARVESAEEAAAIALAHWELGRTTAVVLARPPDESLDDAEPLIEEALTLAEASGVHGQGVTPFVLAHLHEASGGRTLHANRELVVGNAALAGEVAVALAALRR